MDKVLVIIKNIPAAIAGFLRLLHIGIHNSIIPLFATMFAIIAVLIITLFTLFPGLVEEAKPKDFSNVDIARCEIAKKLATYDTEIAYRIVCPK